MNNLSTSYHKQIACKKEIKYELSCNGERPMFFTSTFPIKEIEIDGTTVFYEDSADNLLSYFSKHQAKEFIDLLHRAQIHPKKAYEETLSWKEKHPNNPLVDNLLTFLHLQNKKKAEAESLIVASYHNYPHYFFAQINYADQCLRKKKLKEIPLIFKTFDLQALFPHKTRFHVSEFRGFMILACRYHLLIKKKEAAKKYYQNAYTADPSHLSLVLLEKELFFQNCFDKSLLLFLKFFKLCYAFLVKPRQKGSRISAP